MGKTILYVGLKVVPYEINSTIYALGIGAYAGGKAFDQNIIQPVRVDDKFWSKNPGLEQILAGDQISQVEAVHKFWTWLKSFKSNLICVSDCFEFYSIHAELVRHLGKNPFGNRMVDARSYRAGSMGMMPDKTTMKESGKLSQIAMSRLQVINSEVTNNAYTKNPDIGITRVTPKRNTRSVFDSIRSRPTLSRWQNPVPSMTTAAPPQTYTAYVPPSDSLFNSHYQDTQRRIEEHLRRAEYQQYTEQLAAARANMTTWAPTVEVPSR